MALSAVPTVTSGGIRYREFLLDINQQGRGVHLLLSLDRLIISASATGNLQQAIPASYDPTFGGSATTVYNMDVGPAGTTNGG